MLQGAAGLDSSRPLPWVSMGSGPRAFCTAGPAPQCWGGGQRTRGPIRRSCGLAEGSRLPPARPRVAVQTARTEGLALATRTAGLDRPPGQWPSGEGERRRHGALVPALEGRLGTSWSQTPLCPGLSAGPPLSSGLRLRRVAWREFWGGQVAWLRMHLVGKGGVG